MKRMIEIKSLSNGAHQNQTFHEVLPTGWAIVPDNIEIPTTFPFVNITVENDVVTSMVANQEAYKASVAETQRIESEPSAQDDIDAMLVDQEYRITMLELGITA